jgi:MoaA/NifB/PqqE/SkfB family radical SAM enzyme
VGEAHDAIVGVPGAYGLVKTAMERARSVGLHVGANVFLTKENLADGANLLEQVKRLQLQETSWEVASYYPTARLRHYEAHRPELPDVQPHLEAIRSAAGALGRRWEKPELLTESSHIAKALEGDTAEWEAPQDPEWIDLVCAPNLDIHDGDVFRPVRRYGNLEKDDPAQILEKAMEAKRTGSLITLDSDGLYFEEGPIPSVRELAETVGNPASQTMHYRRTSMRNRWLDLALAERRRRW